MDSFTTPAPAAASASVLSVPSEDERNDSLGPPRKVRSACNRCHSQKLRCVREIGQARCERCFKLKTLCRFGPRAPRASLKSPEQATSRAQDGCHELLSMPACIPTPNARSNEMAAHIGTDTSGSDWLFCPMAETGIAEGRETMHPDLSYPIQGNSPNMQDVYWPSILGESRNLIQLEDDGSALTDLHPVNETIISHLNSLPSPSISDCYMRNEVHNTNGRLGTSVTSAVRRLADLNVALHEYAKTLPSLAKADITSAALTSNTVHVSSKAKIFLIDEIFRLTSEFLDIMECLSSAECQTSVPLSSIHPNQPGTHSTMPSVEYSQMVSYVGQPVTMTSMEPPSRSFSEVDEATMLMVVSCHCRLTEIYASIFQMMQACIEYSLVPQLGKDWAIILPQLQVGSLVSPPVYMDVNTPLPSSTTSSMYILMITMLSSRLWEQLADLMRAGSDVLTGSASPSRCTFVGTMWDTVTDRTERISQTIDATKSLLQRFPVQSA